jgi:hypothetical protein
VNSLVNFAELGAQAARRDLPCAKREQFQEREFMRIHRWRHSAAHAAHRTEAPRAILGSRHSGTRASPVISDTYAPKQLASGGKFDVRSGAALASEIAVFQVRYRCKTPLRLNWAQYDEPKLYRSATPRAGGAGTDASRRAEVHEP